MVYILEHKLLNPFKCLVLLKLLYRSGSVKLNKDDIEFIAFLLNIKIKTVKAYIKKLLEIGWIRLNKKTSFYHLISVDKLRIKHDWVSRISIEINFNDISNIRAKIGAAIFTYLHKDFWRKVKRKKSVQIKGCTYHFLSPSFNYKNHHAPISIVGVSELFNISISQASRLKHLAKQSKFIQIKPKYVEVENVLELNYLKEYYPEMTKNVIYKDGRYYFRLIDHILPLISLRKRRKLTT